MKYQPKIQKVQFFTCQQCHQYNDPELQDNPDHQPNIPVTCPLTACPWEKIITTAA